MDVARVLLAAGADPDLCAPLTEAARRGSLVVARAVLEHGADPEETDPNGRTALEIAEDIAGKNPESQLLGRVGVLVDSLERGREGAELITNRTPLGNGTELLSVKAAFPDGRQVGADMETGHAQIAALLRSGRLPTSR